MAEYLSSKDTLQKLLEVKPISTWPQGFGRVLVVGTAVGSTLLLEQINIPAVQIAAYVLEVAEGIAALKLAPRVARDTAVDLQYNAFFRKPIVDDAERPVYYERRGYVNNPARFSRVVRVDPVDSTKELEDRLEDNDVVLINNLPLIGHRQKHFWRREGKRVEYSSITSEFMGVPVIARTRQKKLRAMLDDELAGKPLDTKLYVNGMLHSQDRQGRLIMEVIDYGSAITDESSPSVGRRGISLPNVVMAMQALSKIDRSPTPAYQAAQLQEAR